MAQPSTLFRFRISLSDIDRGIYESIDLRIAKHPSEIEHFLLSRVIAYCLNYDRALEFPPGGLSDPDQPAMRMMNNKGQIQLWIEIGNPSAKKLHKASKAANEVKVYTYKNPELLLQEMASEKVHKAEQIQIFSLAPSFLDQLSSWLQRDNEWNLVAQEGSLSISSDKGSLESELKRHQAAN